MAVTTLYYHIKRAVEFFNKTDVYFAIGKTSPWEDENNPPLLDPNTQDIDEIVGFKKLDTIQLVVPDPGGTIQFRNQNWRIITPDQAVAQKSRWVYVEATIMYDELPLGYYRQVGLYSGVVPNVGVPSGQTALLPSEVASNGTLEVYDNRLASPRVLNQKEKLYLVIEL